MMVLSPRLTLLAVIFTCCWMESSGRVSCSGNTVRCNDDSKCINLHHVCRAGNQCSDGSDEDTELCKFWRYSSDYCGNSGNFMHSGGCYSAKDMCSNQIRSASIDSRICKIVSGGELKVTPEGMRLTEEVMSQLGAAVNSTLDATPDCPLLYTRVGNVCLSFFSLAKVPWAEARQFCQAISGDLLDIKDNIAYGQVLQYMKETSLTSNYWLGGRYDMDTNSWAWSRDDSPMPLGSPFWALNADMEVCGIFQNVLWSGTAAPAALAHPLTPTPSETQPAPFLDPHATITTRDPKNERQDGVPPSPISTTTTSATRSVRNPSALSASSPAPPPSVPTHISKAKLYGCDICRRHLCGVDDI